MATSPALESLFATAEQKAADLLENLTAAINSKVTTIEEGEALVQKLSEEAARFNQILVTLDNTKAQVESGDITREQGLGIVEPLVKELKSNCVALSMCGVSFSDSDDIDVEEIAVLREIIAGAKNAAEARVVALRTHADLSPDTESMGVLEAFNSSVANENLTDVHKYLSLRNSTEAKNAKLLAQNARKLYSMGSKDKANEYMAKAKALYQKCLDEAKKSAKWVQVERTTTGSTSNKKGTSANTISDKFKTEVTDDWAVSSIVVYFEDRVDSCEAYLRQWKNKAGNVDLKATKAALKAERKAERDAKRAEKKAAKEAAKGANESMNPMFDAETLKLVDALEAYASQCDSEVLTMALESDGDAASTSSAVSAAKSGDPDAAISQLNDSLDTAAAEAKKGNPKKAIAIAAGVAASLVAVITLASKLATGKFPHQHAAKALAAMKEAREAKKAAAPTEGDATSIIGKIKGALMGAVGSIKDAFKKFGKKGDDAASESFELDAGTQNLVAALEAYAAQCDSEVLTMALESDGEAVSSSSATAAFNAGDGDEAVSNMKSSLETAAAEAKKGNVKKAIAIAVGVAAALVAILTVAGKVKTGKFQLPHKLLADAWKKLTEGKKLKAMGDKVDKTKVITFVAGMQAGLAAAAGSIAIASKIKAKKAAGEAAPETDGGEDTTDASEASGLAGILADLGVANESDGIDALVAQWAKEDGIDF